MLKQIHKLIHCDWFKPSFYVACLWLVGLLIGKWLALDLSEEALDVVRSSVIGRRSFVLLLARSVLPMLLAALLVRRCKKKYLYFVILLKALLLSFSLCVVIRAFDSAGWLVATLVFTTELLSCFIFVISVLLFLCIEIKTLKKVLLMGGALCVVFSVLDYFVLLPFVGSLFQ